MTYGMFTVVCRSFVLDMRILVVLITKRYLHVSPMTNQNRIQGRTIFVAPVNGTGVAECGSLLSFETPSLGHCDMAVSGDRSWNDLVVSMVVREPTV